MLKGKRKKLFVMTCAIALSATSVLGTPVQTKAAEDKGYEVLVDKKLEYSDIHKFHNGVAIVEDNNYNYGVIDINGNEVIPCNKDQATFLNGNNYISFYYDGGYKEVYDIKGNLIISGSEEYEQPQLSNNGKFIVDVWYTSDEYFNKKIKDINNLIDDKYVNLATNGSQDYIIGYDSTKIGEYSGEMTPVVFDMDGRKLLELDNCTDIEKFGEGVFNLDRYVSEDNCEYNIAMDINGKVVVSDKIIQDLDNMEEDGYISSYYTNYTYNYSIYSFSYDYYDMPFAQIIYDRKTDKIIPLKDYELLYEFSNGSVIARKNSDGYFYLLDAHFSNPKKIDIDITNEYTYVSVSEYELTQYASELTASGRSYGKVAKIVLDTDKENSSVDYYVNDIGIVLAGVDEKETNPDIIVLNNGDYVVSVEDHNKLLLMSKEGTVKKIIATGDYIIAYISGNGITVSLNVGEYRYILLSEENGTASKEEYKSIIPYGDNFLVKLPSGEVQIIDKNHNILKNLGESSYFYDVDDINWNSYREVMVDRNRYSDANYYDEEGNILFSVELLREDFVDDNTQVGYFSEGYIPVQVHGKWSIYKVNEVGTKISVQIPVQKDEKPIKNDGVSGNNGAGVNNNGTTVKDDKTTGNNNEGTTAVAKPSKATIKQAKNSKKKAIVVTLKKTKNAKKHQLQYATNKKFKKAKRKTITKLTYTIKKLKKGKTYYVRVRGINGSKCGAWSKVKKVKIKK